jgi:hypothetical protein
VAFATAEAQLTRHAFGWRQLAALTTGLAVAVSLGAVGTEIVRGPWGAYAVGEPAIPAFIVSAAEEGEAFRVLVLADADGAVQWEVVDGLGPTMEAFGVAAEAAGTDLVGPAVDDALAGRDPYAASRLGMLNVRYVVVPDGGQSPRLDEALRAQIGLEPRPVASGRVLSVTGWVPRIALVDDEVAASVATRGDVPADADVRPLRALEPGRYRGSASFPGTLLVAERADDGWTATADGRRLPRTDGATPRFEEVAENATVELLHTGGVARSFAVTGQLLVLLLAISLALRPPRFARQAEAVSTRADEPPARTETPEVVG